MRTGILTAIIMVLAPIAYAGQVCVDIPDANMAEFHQAFADTYHYEAQVADPADTKQKIPNPETVAAFAKRKLAEYVNAVIEAADIEAAVKTARETTQKKPKRDIK